MDNFKFPKIEHFESLLQNQSIIFYVALNDNFVIGGLTAYTLSSVYFQSSEIYVYDLAVKTEFQRQGIGKQLLTELQNYCKLLGNKEVFIQAEIADQQAVDFYRATGGREERVLHYSYDLTNDRK